VSDNTENPCHDLELPNTDGPSGAPVPPELPELKFDPPLFPIVERDFPETGVPLSRSVTMVPRNLFYADLEMVFSWEQGKFRSPGQEGYPNLTLNNPAGQGGRAYDSFRYVAGKVFGEKKRNNYVFSDSLVPDPQSGLDFKIIVDPTQPIVERHGDVTLSKNRVRCMFTIDAIAERFGQRNDEQIQGFIKLAIPEASSPIIFTDTAFSAPASFFYREADGLNMRLPDLTKMQVFISDYISQEAQEGLYDTESNNSVSEVSKKSLYEKFSMEYEERPEYCIVPGTGVTTHKYPANKIGMINSITETATTVAERNDSEFSSFRRVFKRNYDFYTRISFDTNHTSPIASKMKELNIDPLFLGMLDVESPSDESIYTQIMDETIQGFVGVSNNDGVSLNYRPNTYEDFLQKLERYTDPNGSELYDDLKLVLDPATFPMSYQAQDNFLSEQASADVDGSFVPYYSSPQQVLNMMFNRWFTGYIADKKRTFKKIMNSELSYSEVVAYRLEKRNAQTGEVVQNFYFSNDPDTNRIDYVDTQVLFGKRYEYSLYTVNMVLGSDYQYKRDLDANGYPKFSHDQGGGFTFQFDVHQTDNVSFIEAPYFQQELLIVDAPPMPPDVWFLPVETLTTDMVWFWFVPRLGQELQRPIAILEEDLEIIEKMKLSQNVGIHQNTEIRYKSDSDPTHYQLLVLDTPPLSYQDFSLGRKDETTIASPSFKKSVMPNKDYYITFRARDFAGISNPSKVYRYRLNSFGDGVRHEIEEYNFAEETQENFLSFNQVVSVAPSANQRAINFQSSDAYSENLGDTRELLETTKGVAGLTLGVDDDNRIWDKKFLIEVVSTVTGKKIQVMTTWRQLVMRYEEVIPEYEIIESQQNAQLSQGCYTADTRDRQAANATRANSEVEANLRVDPTRAQQSRGNNSGGSY
jgi:hypothetical protein